MTPLTKQIGGGVSIAVSGAFLWALFRFSYWFSHGANPGKTIIDVIVYTAYAVFVASWFVIPLGIFVGVFMPKLIRRCSPGTAFLRGAMLGVFAAFVAALLTSVLMEWASITGVATRVDREAWWNEVTHRFLFDFATMSFICALWVGVWAARRSWRSGLTRSCNEQPPTLLF
jgi:hypothetical protein